MNALAPYRKLIAYAVAAALLLVHRYLGLDLTGTGELWVELVIAAVGGWGIWRVPNAPLPPQEPTS